MVGLIEVFRSLGAILSLKTIMKKLIIYMNLRLSRYLLIGNKYQILRALFQ